ncbi:MAG: HAD-IA family hydrolase [Inquilinus sp.]|nr:HAD-IA family hydrolase [Inquilinus sp.]
MTARLRLAQLDCDGTLVDSRHSIVAAMSAAWATFGLGEPDPSAVRRSVGLPVVEAVARLLPDRPAAEHEESGTRYREAFFELRRSGDLQEPLYPGVREALDALEAAGLLLGIATGKSRRGLVATLERYDLLDCFVTLQTADDGPGKPNPHLALRALDEAGVEAADAVMIGDTVFDMEMARAARIRGLGVAWGYHDTAELRAAGADAIAERFDDVPPLVTAMLGA